jgi:hypothetical protein
MRKNTQMTWWRTSRRVWGCARTVPGVPQSKSPRGGSFLEKERARERERERERERGRERERDVERSFCGLGTRKKELLTYLLATRSHLRAARVDSPRRTRGQSARCADGPAHRRGRSVICTRTSSITPIALEPRRRSTPHRRTVRQVQPDSPTHWADNSTCLFLFQLDIL